MGRRVRLASALVGALLLVVAIVLGLAAHDAWAWRSQLRDGDRRLERDPKAASWRADTWLPDDPVRSLAGLDDGLQVRRAVRFFQIAQHTGNGFDAGATRSRVRADAEVALSDAADHGPAASASQASNLLGVLVIRGGQVVGGVTADDRARSAFEAAIRRDPSNTEAKYNLELLLRRTTAQATRQGQGNGTGSLGRGRRGAGAGTPGRGY
jgi:hypothetical protein